MTKGDTDVISDQSNYQAGPLWFTYTRREAVCVHSLHSQRGAFRNFSCLSVSLSFSVSRSFAAAASSSPQKLDLLVSLSPLLSPFHFEREREGRLLSQQRQSSASFSLPHFSLVGGHLNKTSCSLQPAMQMVDKLYALNYALLYIFFSLISNLTSFVGSAYCAFNLSTFYLKQRYTE